jgi:hypothetical protein
VSYALPERPNHELLRKLRRQISEHQAHRGYDPSILTLTHDEIDAWRNQFDTVIPVGSLAYQGIPIKEQSP